MWKHNHANIHTVHVNCKPNFTSTKTGLSYPLRHNFTCSSKNIIYLITCTRCKKQYVGLTTQVNVRINHHRTNIFNLTQTYISNHFNFVDYSISHLSVQIIDTPSNGPNMQQELRHLKRYWINTLKTVQPFGLNISPGKNVIGSEKRGNFAQKAKFWHFSSCHHSKVPRAIGFILGL